MELLVQIIEVAVIPLLGVLTAYIVKLVNAKIEAISAEKDNELEKKYLNMLNDTITNCVIATTQTYVDNLKKNNAFTLEAQQEAFRLTYEAVTNIISEDAVIYLTEVVGDLQLYIRQKIEAEVSINKASV